MQVCLTLGVLGECGACELVLVWNSRVAVFLVVDTAAPMPWPCVL